MQSEHFVLVALAAEKFSCRPSRMVGLDDPVLALDFDLAAAARLMERERALLNEIRSGPDEDSAETAHQRREERW